MFCNTFDVFKDRRILWYISCIEITLEVFLFKVDDFIKFNEVIGWEENILMITSYKIYIYQSYVFISVVLGFISLLVIHNYLHFILFHTSEINPLNSLNSTKVENSSV